MSEVTGLVNIHTAKLGGGFTDGGRPFVKAEMELRGTVMTLFHGEHRGQVAEGTQTSFSVEIDFTEEQTRSDDIEDHVTKAYIGLCHLRMIDKEIRVSLRITLPMTMYQHILLLGREDIWCETIQDANESPTPQEHTNHVAAYVTRVYFDKRYWWDRK